MRDTLIPSLQLDVDTVGEEDCYDAWREAVRAVYDVEPGSTGPSSATESVKAWLLKDLIFSDVQFSAQSFRHHSILSKNSNYLSLQLYRTGGSSGLLHDQAWDIAPGDIHIFDFSREFYSNSMRSSVLGVVIPHHIIGFDPAQHDEHVVYPGKSPVGRFLANALRGLFDQLPRADKTSADQLSEGFCGLLQGMLSLGKHSDARDVDRQEERRKDLRAFVDRHICDTALGVEFLCRQFNISRPSLYREFAASGGVANYITQRRLERAYYQLASAPEGYKPIKDIAYGVGFGDPGHFSRLFRRRFGLTPKEAASLDHGKRMIRFQPTKSEKQINFGLLSDWIHGI